MPFYIFLRIHMVSVRSLLGKSVHTACQKFDGLITRPHLGNLREMILGMLLAKSCHLSRIGTEVSAHVIPRKNAERYSNALEKIDPVLCTKKHIACKAPLFRDEPTLFLCDGGDVQKPFAKVMKHVCVNVDGSNGHAVGRGYPTFACVAYGLESKQQIPLYHHLYSTVTKEFNSQWAEQMSCYTWLAPFLNSTKDRIIVNDRGGDDEKQLLYVLQVMHMSFLTRINTGENARHLCIVLQGESGGKVPMSQIICDAAKRAGSAKQWKNRKLKKICTSRIAFQEVRLPDHPNIPLFLVLLFTEGFKDPIVLLTDIDVRDTTKAWTVFFWYKKRWEVENFFRAIKQQFGAEKFLILSYKAIKTLAFVQMLAFSLLLEMKATLKESLCILTTAFLAFCARWQRNKESHLDLLHWIREEWGHARRAAEPSYRSWSRRMRDCLQQQEESISP
jgi:hypothetical protein